MTDDTDTAARFVDRDNDPKYWIAIIGGKKIGGFRSEAEARKFVREVHFQYQTDEDFLNAHLLGE
jgi:hypothetical protein